MKYIMQFAIIIVISFVGEILNYLIPFPIPGSIYGMLILFFALLFKVIKVEQVKDVGSFLIKIMPIMFIPAAVGMIDVWSEIENIIIPITIITLLTTIIVMISSGLATNLVLACDSKKDGGKQ